MTTLSGVIGWFASSSGVVMPTLIPQTVTFAEGLSGVTAVGLSVGVCIATHMAALSPMSTCGALMLAAYSSDENVDDKARSKMFAQLFIMSIGGVLFSCVLAAIGFY
jgi:hypothetical protein